MLFFFSSRRRHTSWPRDWSSDVCSSDLHNRRARHEYFIEEIAEAGLVLEGWEVKAIRAGRVQLAESYVTVRDGELWVIGMHISPLSTTSTHIKPDPTRSRKLLMHRHEINKLIGQVDR